MVTMAWATRHKQIGFTVVELLVVIAVIGILASIIIVTYDGVVERARDTRRHTDLSTLSDALKVYAATHDDLTMKGSGCGQFGDGNGWINVTNETLSSYQNSITNCLREAGILPEGVVLTDPLNDGDGNTVCDGLGCYMYGKYNCPDGVYLYAHLETLPQTSSDTDATCNPTYDTAYGYNYYIKIE